MIDYLLSAKRDTVAAKRFLGQSLGVDPTLLSPAAKSITREPIASSCRDQTDHTGSVRQRPCRLGAATGVSHNGPKTSVKDSTKFLGFLGGLLRQSIRCEDQTAQNLVGDVPAPCLVAAFNL
jgi:hypothetical protein